MWVESCQESKLERKRERWVTRTARGPCPKQSKERERETECDTLFLNPQHVFSKKFGGISTSMGEMSYVSVHATRIRYRNPYGLRRGRHYTRLSLPAVLTQCSLKPGDVDPSLSPDRERERVCVCLRERAEGGRPRTNCPCMDRPNPLAR